MPHIATWTILRLAYSSMARVRVDAMAGMVDKRLAGCCMTWEFAY